MAAFTPTFLGRLPDDILTWRGTAAALALKCNELLPVVGIVEDAGCANERLVRHYVQVGVLTRPERDRREALFDQRHVRQFLTARFLLRDGWPLAKITELLRSTGIEQLTTAVRATQKVRADTSHRPPAVQVGDDNDPFRGIPLYLRRSAPVVPPPPAASQAVLSEAAENSRRRIDFKSMLSALGNPTGQPERRALLRITLTPWCDVYVDGDKLARLLPNSAEVLGSALTEALREELMQRREKT